jgi:hypothetical protein
MFDSPAKSKIIRGKVDNFLTSHHLPPPRRRHPWRKPLLFLTVIFLLLFLVLWPALMAGAGILKEVALAEKNLKIISSQIQAGNWYSAGRQLKLLQTEVLKINSQFHRLGPISYLPPVKKSLAASQRMLLASGDLASAYAEIFFWLADVSDDFKISSVADKFSDKNQRQNLLGSLAGNQAKLSQIQLKLAAAQQELSAVNTNDLLGPFQDNLLIIDHFLATAIGNTETALPIIAHLPELLGYHQEKTYLVVFQNNMELRPTGGFIGSYAILKIKDGEITGLFTDDIYNLDKLSIGQLKETPPWPMQQYNAQKYWYLRDANWSPDWPTSAEKIKWFFNQESALAHQPPLKLDGVIALNPDFIVNLLEVVGPIMAEGLTFQADNFAQDLEKFVEFDYAKKGIKKEDRKDIIGFLTNVVIERLYQSPPRDLLKIWLAFKSNIDEKNILVYLTDPKLQAHFYQQNWSGQVKTVDGDYLLLVDSNLGALKTDQAMRRAISYQVQAVPNGELAARLEITYQHQSRPMKDLISKYRDYVRVYVPPGSWFTRGYLVGHNGVVKELKLQDDLLFSQELGKTVAATFLTVEPGQSQTLVLEYRLPQTIQDLYRQGLYKFSVQKQPGTSGHDFKIYLDFNQEIQAYQAETLPQRFNGQSILWQTTLSVDRDYLVKF